MKDFSITMSEELKKLRIGEFAKKHNITQDTIRHYLDLGLLATEKNGGHYRFSDDDSWDVEKIKELKQLEFSLAQIQEILNMKRLAGMNTETFRNLYLSYLEEKKEQAAQELNKYVKMNENVKLKIKELKLKESNHKSLGFPIFSLHLLECPICRRPLPVSDGTIERNMIINAQICCDCGFIAQLEEGIYIDQRAVRTRTLNGQRMPTKEEFLASSSNKYINFLYKGITTSIEYIERFGEQPNYIMELDNCVGFFLMQYINCLPPNTTYVLMDYDLARLRDLKKNIEMYHSHKNFIFLCCDIDQIPLSKLSMDIIIDNIMMANNEDAENNLLIGEVLSLLDYEGLLISTSRFTSRERQISGEKRSSMSKKNLHNKLERAHINKIDEVEIGPVTEENPLCVHEMEHYQTIYAGKKQSVGR